jgi:hypothetical protein
MKWIILFVMVLMDVRENEWNAQGKGISNMNFISPVIGV